VTANGVVAKVEGGGFSMTVPVDPRTPRVVVEATDAAGNASEKLTVTLKVRAKEGVFRGLTLVETDGRGLPTYTLDKDPSVVLLLVPAGEFVMGAVRGDEAAKTDEVVSRRTAVPQFLIGRAEVTWAQFDRFCDATGRKKLPVPEGAGPSHPVTCSSVDATAWCEWAGLRLPKESEWERAARGGVEGQLFSWGSDLHPPKGAANLYDEARHKKTNADTKEYWSGYDDGYVETSPVGSFAANGFGLVDVTGNVWEWCGDPYDRSREPKRVLRGGGFDTKPTDCRLSRRNGQHPGFVNAATGFRPVRDAN
jgi:formylglycine-generating enzyme required for sulfatase activity